MNQYNDDPLNYPAGTEFDYSVWEPGTSIVLCNVPWDSVYRTTAFFGEDDATTAERRTLLNGYIDNLVTPKAIIGGGSPVRVDIPVRVGISHNLAQKYNYLRARNPLLPNGANPGGDEVRDYYYFVNNVKYINPGTTELTLQLDVWTTYMYDVEIGNSFIEHGHVGVANENQMRNNGRDFLTVPEGMDTGGEYRIVTTRSEHIDEITNGERYSILLCSAVDLNAEPGEQGSKTNPPKLVTATGGRFSGMASGATYYVLSNFGALEAFMDYWKDKPWLTQGILSITIIPPINRYIPGFAFTGGVDDGLDLAPENLRVSLFHDLFTDWRNSATILNAIPARYRRFKKFMCFPYMAIELTTYTGTPLILRPEAWNNPNASIIERPALIPPQQRLIFFPRFYNTTGNPINGIQDDDPGEYMDMMTQISGFPSVALVNNSAIGYLASNQNSINQQYASNEWSQQRAIRGAQVGYDNTQVGMNAAREQTDATNQYGAAQLGVQQALERQNMLYNAVGGGAMSAAGGLAAGPIGGAVGAIGGVGGGVLGALTMNNSQAAAQQQMGNTVNQNWRSTDINNSSTQLVADANKGLAEFGAQGDYKNAQAALQAKVQDTKLLQPSTSGQTGGEFLNFIHQTLQVAARWKMIDPAAMATMGEFWLEFGYAVHRRYTPPKSLQVMSNFTYWKIQNPALRVANMPEGFKNVLRGILEKGTTVYKNPNDINNIDFVDNVPRTGIAL